MLKFLKKREQSQGIMSWMYKAVRSAAMDAGRSTSRELRAVMLDQDGESDSSICEQADEYGCLYLNGNYIVREEDIEIDVMPQLKNMLSKLSKPLRQVLVLYSEGYNYQEIAAMTN